MHSGKGKGAARILEIFIGRMEQKIPVILEFSGKEDNFLPKLSVTFDFLPAAYVEIWVNSFRFQSEIFGFYGRMDHVHYLLPILIDAMLQNYYNIQ